MQGELVFCEGALHFVSDSRDTCMFMVIRLLLSPKKANFHFFETSRSASKLALRCFILISMVS